MVPKKRKVKNRIPQSRIDRFWRKIDRMGRKECWPWNASVRSNGLPAFWWKDPDTGKPVQGNAHIFMWVHVMEWELPKGLFVGRSCGNALCVNPAHLMLKHKKRSMLTPSAVKTIRRLRARGRSVKDIAELFGIHRTTVWDIVTTRRWAKS